VTRDQQFVIIFAALLVASPEMAHAVVKTTTQVIQGGSSNDFSETFNFPDVANADDLVSISNGYAYYAEGGTLSISVDYSDATSAQIFMAFNLADISLTSVPSSPFGRGTIDGFTFTLTDGDDAEFDIPVGTSFVIGVPEPATWVTMLVGFGLVGAVMRSARRTRRVRGRDLRAELRVLA